MARGASLTLPGQRPVVRRPSVVPGAALSTPSQQPNVGASLSTPSQTGPGRGAAFNQTGAATGTSVGQTGGTIRPTTITKTNQAPGAPPPPDMSGDKWMAYLTPDQRTALLNAGTQASSSIGSQQQREGNAQDAYTTSTANSQYAHDVNQDQVNQEMAARGMFLSSDRDNSLTDLNRTLVNNNAAALSSLNSIITDATSQIANINTQYGQTILGAQGNAAAQVPVTAPPPAAPPVTTTTPIPRPPAAPSAPAAGKPAKGSVASVNAPKVPAGAVGYHGGF